MKSKMFFCKSCEKFFCDTKTYYETHGLKSPPYEKVAICPNCESDDFCEFDIYTEKFDLAEGLLWAILSLNKLGGDLNKIFGSQMKNDNLSEAIGIIAEMLNDMFDFMSAEAQKKILRLNNEGDLQRIFDYLKGGL